MCAYHTGHILYHHISVSLDLPTAALHSWGRGKWRRDRPALLQLVGFYLVLEPPFTGSAGEHTNSVG